MMSANKKSKTPIYASVSPTPQRPTSATSIKKETKNVNGTKTRTVEFEEKYDEYADDFNDYDDDFEELEIQPVDVAKNSNELESSMQKESERRVLDVQVKKNLQSSHDSILPIPSLQTNTRQEPISNEIFHLNPIIDPQLYYQETDKSIQFACKKQERFRDLTTLIDLDFASYFLFDLPPMNEYDVYMQKYGNSNSNQISTQTMEDNGENCVQTDVISMQDRWVQATQEYFIDSGLGKTLLNANTNTNTITKESKKTLKQAELESFLFRMTGFIENELEEENQDSENESQLGILSSKSILYELENPLNIKKRLLQIHIESDRIYCLEVNLDNQDPIQAWITVWNSCSNSTPERILICPSIIQSITTCPSMPGILIAGTLHGSIQVWDLLESNPDDYIQFKNKLIGSWYPSYCTDGLSSESCHSNPIASLKPLEQHNHKTNQVHSCQFASIDESGHFILWTLVRLGKEYAHRYDLDYGMKLNSRIRISKSFTNQFLSRNIKGHAVSCFEFVSRDKLLIGTDLGSLVLHSRHSGSFIPIEFQYSFFDIPFQDKITCIHTLDQSDSLSELANFQKGIFLVGYESGTLALYSIDSNRPLLLWKEYNSPIKRVIWSPYRSCVFASLDDKGALYVYDLLESHSPIFSYSVESESLRDKKSKIIEFEWKKTLRKPGLLLGYENGQIEWHILNESMIQKSIDEDKEFVHFISDFKIQ